LFGNLFRKARFNMKTLLLVDDEAILLEMYGDILRKSGYSVIARPDGRSALAVLQEGRRVDLVITDCQMPRMDGFEFIANLKQIDPSVPVVMMSAEVSAEKYTKALDLGAIECAEKPKVFTRLAKMAAAALTGQARDGKAPKLNCWEVMRCGREPGGAVSPGFEICPAATDAALNGLHGGKNAGRACWAVAGTLCLGKTLGTYVKEKQDCRQCDFFKKVRAEEEQSLFGFSAARPDIGHALVKLRIREQRSGAGSVNPATCNPPAPAGGGSAGKMLRSSSIR
jgi:CheY-like chemotaxis protein